MKENVFKFIAATVIAGLTAYLKIMAIPLIILVGVMLVDYISGMIKAWNKSELNSRIGVAGVLKKLGYLLVVCVGMCVDWVISTGLNQVGIEYNNSFIVGLIVTIWLIINELISILENLSIIGVPMPSFLVNMISKLKVTVENKTEEE